MCSYPTLHNRCLSLTPTAFDAASTTDETIIPTCNEVNEIDNLERVIPAEKMAHFPTFLASGGEMGRRIREFDWSQHPLGPPEEWPNSLQDIGPRAESVVRTGEATWDESLPLFLERSGFPEETYHTFSYSPVPQDDGSIGGIFCVVTEETERVIGERRLALLRDLGADLASIKSEEELFRAVQKRLSRQSKDLPFSLVYLLSADGKAAHLAGAHPAEPDIALAPPSMSFDGVSEVWPATRLFASGTPVLVSDLGTQFEHLPTAPWDRAPRDALLVPIAQQGQEQPAGFLVAGLNPYRPLDAAYRGFLDLLAGQIAAGLASARAYEAERKRAEALAEIDRAKTAFFSNVSHEFRTPLTLLLGPLEEILAKPAGEVLEDNRRLADIAQRNGLRLLKLVNSLLDFARIEAGRTRAHFEPTDLATYTAELASSFRSAMEKAGLKFTVECTPLAELVYLDREMWEKIVLNLLSNAFKFTLVGEVRVTVRPLGDTVEMSVRDTGAGIPEEAMAHLFERFYRVQGTPGRTHEGSGIGLALVHDLVKLHGGTVHVESEEGVGSVFSVTIPRGVAHLPAEQCAPASTTSRKGNTATAFVAEALRWLPEETFTTHATDESDLSTGPIHPTPKSRILLADDNADMRDYVARLLSPRFQVVAVADGRSALDAALEERPDLVLTDVMMPRLDGFGLLREMRADSALRTVPIILLSARAGEEARVEGLEAGADDYLTKPFHARELLAKINSSLTLARVRAEAQARESELQAERIEILERMNLAFMAMDADFRIVYLNAEASRMHDMTPEKYLGRTHWEAFPAANGTHIESNYRLAMTERKPVKFENFYAPWQRWFEINAYPMSGGRLGVFFRDITESKRLEVELRRSEALHRSIGESIDYGVWVCAPDGRNTYASESFLKLLGITQEQCSDFGWGDRLSPEESARTIADWQACTRTGGKWDREHRFLGADGQWHSILTRGVPVQDEHGAILCWAGINLDITHRKEIEDALRSSEARFRQIADTMPQMVWATHPDGRHDYFNRRWYDFAGLDESSLGPWPGLFHPDDEKRARVEWQQKLASGEPYEIEYRLRRHDGKYCWFLCRALPVFDDDGQILRWFGTCTDIDEFKRVEAALQQAKAAAENANSSKDRFIAVLSHELRTPLTPVLMAISAWENDPDLSEEMREDLVMMKRNIELETKLIDDLLDLNRITSGKLPLNLEPVDLNEAVRQVCGICRPAFEERAIHLEITLNEDTGLVAADRARLQQVLWNVLKNAIKFTPESGAIRVTAKRLDGDRCEVRMQDNGIGIPADVLPRIFNAFEQGDASVTREFGGLGLGLAICKALVDLHRGAIRAESDGPGHGATFVIELPGATPAPAAASALIAPNGESNPRALRVLLVEDHPDTSLMLARLLRRQGFVVTTAADLASASALAESELFDVLVSDLGLPDGTGYEVIRRVRDHQNVPGIAMSGFGMEDDVRRTREAGFIEHLVKPIDVAQLIDAIRRVSKSLGEPAMKTGIS